MKKGIGLTFFVFSLLTFSSIVAQPVNWDEIIPPDEAGHLALEERLVQLCWQNYSQNRLAEQNLSLAEKQTELAKWSWLEDLSINFNLNPRTIESFGDFSVSDDNNFFPWYNVGLSFSPGTVINTKTKVVEAEFDAWNSQKLIEHQKLTIRAEVLSRYSLYKHKLEQLKVISEGYETANSNYILTRSRFNNGEADLEEFNLAAQALTEAGTGKMEAELLVDQAKIRIEELIGMRLEQVAN
jgi:outer membrane protein TolC